MSTNNHNAGTELNDVNVGALAIADGNNDNDNDNDNDEGGHDINAAELLGLPEDHPIVKFFNDDESCLPMDVIVLGGVQVAGKIRCSSKDAWSLFGGDANWNELLAVHTLPLTYRGLGLGKLEAGPSMDYLKRRVTDAPAAPRPPPKPLSEYSYEFDVTVLGEKVRSFVNFSFHAPGGVGIVLLGDFGKRLLDAFKTGGGAPTYGRGRVVDANISITVFDKSTGKFATFVQSGEMNMQEYPNVHRTPYFESTGGYAVIHDHLDAIDDPGATERVPMFRTKTTIDFIGENIIFTVAFINVHREHVQNKDQILRLMERLEWK